MKNISKLILTSWSFKEGLIQSSVLPYLKMIKKIDSDGKLYFVTDEKKSLELTKEEKEATHKELLENGIFWKPQPYHNFGLIKILFSVFTFFKLWCLIIFKRVKVIHAFCTPAGVIGYFLSILTGAKLVIDSYEPHAESMVENNTWTKDSKAFKILWNLEKRQSQRAYWCIGAASGMQQYAKDKWGVTLKNFSVRPTCADLEKFSWKEEERTEKKKLFGLEDKIVAVYAGKFGGIYLDKEVFDLLEVAWKFWGEKLRIMILSNQSKNEIKEFYKHTEIPEGIFIIKEIPYTQMPQHLAAADFALTPVKPVPSKRYCSPIKDGEYWAMGLPVIITNNISDDSEIISNNNIGYVLKTLSQTEYKNAVLKIDSLINEPNLKNKIRGIAIKYRSYQIAETVYREIYNPANFK